MRFVDEFRDPAAARALVRSITELAGADEFKFMEICGGHTHTIYRHGIEHLLPESVQLVHGPGCPVCVIPMGRIDDAMWLAEQPGIIFTTFGDMMRVPGSNGSLLDAKARGADVRFVYSPLDALKVALDNPDRRVVFFAVGFETTAPSTAVTLVRARELGVRTLFSSSGFLPATVVVDRVQIQQVLINLIRNAMEAMRESEVRELKVDVSAVGNGFVAVEVADTGPGISDEVVTRLFQPFVTTKAGGMGIGLSISRRIIEAHGGELTCRRNERGGATFRFTLPVSMEQRVVNER